MPPTLPKLAPIVIGGAGTALFVGGAEMPMRKVELKRTAGTQNVEGSTSAFQGAVWQEFGRSTKGWTASISGVLRSSLLLGAVPGGNSITTGISPLDIVEGESYLCHFFVQRPGWIVPAAVGPPIVTADPGFGYWGNLMFEDIPVPTLDPTSGGLEWSASGKGQGPLSGPAAPPAPVPPT